MWFSNNNVLLQLNHIFKSSDIFRSLGNLPVAMSWSNTTSSLTCDSTFILCKYIRAVILSWFFMLRFLMLIWCIYFAIRWRQNFMTKWQEYQHLKLPGPLKHQPIREQEELVVLDQDIATGKLPEMFRFYFWLWCSHKTIFVECASKGKIIWKVHSILWLHP
jgi:hypothetical protein